MKQQCGENLSRQHSILTSITLNMCINDLTGQESNEAAKYEDGRKYYNLIRTNKAGISNILREVSYLLTVLSLEST